MTLGELHQNSHHSSDEEVSSRGKGGGGLLPYISLLGMYRPKGYSFAPFRSETGTDFARFGLPGLVFQGSTGFINVSVVSIPADETGKKANL